MKSTKRGEYSSRRAQLVESYRKWGIHLEKKYQIKLYFSNYIGKKKYKENELFCGVEQKNYINFSEIGGDIPRRVLNL